MKEFRPHCPAWTRDVAAAWVHWCQWFPKPSLGGWWHRRSLKSHSRCQAASQRSNTLARPSACVEPSPPAALPYGWVTTTKRLTITPLWLTPRNANMDPINSLVSRLVKFRKGDREKYEDLGGDDQARSPGQVEFHAHTPGQTPSTPGSHKGFAEGKYCLLYYLIKIDIIH